MGKAYSEDLRLKALAALDGGMKKMAVHRAFGISRSTLDDWVALREQQGHLAPPRPVGRTGRGFFNAAKFEAFARRHQEATLGQMRGSWEREGARRGATAEREDVLDLACSSGLDAQKKSWLYAERDEGERADFLKQLAPVALEDRVYVDEAGVEDTLGFAWGWSLRGVRCLAQKLGHRTSRVSMAAAWCCGQGAGAFDVSGAGASDVSGLLPPRTD